MTERDPSPLAADNAAVNRQLVRVLAVGGWWGVGFATLLVLGPGLDLPLTLAVPAAAAVAALSGFPGWALVRDRAATREAIHRIAAHQRAAQLQQLQSELASVPVQPSDPRAVAARQLLARIEQVGDAPTREVARAAERELLAALADVRMLHAAVDADRAASPDDLPVPELAAALEAREGDVDGLLRAIRELHATLAVQSGATREVLASLRGALDRARADAEVGALRSAARPREGQ